jgi:hypothetical protein
VFCAVNSLFLFFQLEEIPELKLELELKLIWNLKLNCNKIGAIKMFDDAKHIFRHYMRMVWEKNGWSYDPDYGAEWDSIFESMENDIKKLIAEEIKKAQK